MINGVKLRVGDVWVTEGGRRYKIVAHDPSLFPEFPWSARYFEEGYQYGKPAAFNDKGQMMDGFAKLARWITREL
jgi:hypothetical protein